MVQNASKDVKVSEKDLFKTARVASKLSKNNDVTGLIGKDRDEAELRNKLVSNLKEKEIKKMKECGDKIRNDKLYSDGDESREEISEEEDDNVSVFFFSKNSTKNFFFFQFSPNIFCFLNFFFKNIEKLKISFNFSRDLLGIEMNVGIEMSVVIALPSQK